MSFAIAGTVVTAGTAAYGAHQAGNAADAQVRAARDATALTDRQYQQTRADTSSGRSLYEGANRLLGNLYGINVQGSQQYQDQAPIVFGDTELPAGAVAANPSDPKGSDILLNGQVIGHVYPGGSNGRFRASPGVDVNQLMRDSRSANQPNMQAGGAGGLVTPGSPGGSGQPDNMAGFFTSPDYNFRRDEGNRDIQSSFAARGGARSGNALRALTEFNSNLASGEFGNYFNRLTTLAGLGGNATNTTINAGANAANSASQNSLLAGDARASGIANQTNAINNGIGQIGTLAGYYNRNRNGVSGGYGAPVMGGWNPGNMGGGS